MEEFTFSSSDHHFITFSVTITDDESSYLSSIQSYDVETDTEGFLETIKILPLIPSYDSPENINTCFSLINNWLRDAMVDNTKTKQLNAKTVWFTPKIDKMRCALKKLNRMRNRSRNKFIVQIYNLIESTLRQLYRKEIRTRKNNSWRSFISQSKA